MRGNRAGVHLSLGFLLVHTKWGVLPFLSPWLTLTSTICPTPAPRGRKLNMLFILVSSCPPFTLPRERENSNSKTLILKDSMVRSIWAYLTASPCYTTDNSNSKTLILKDSSIRSIWAYLTASPCYTTNINKHDNTTNKYYKHV